MVGVSVLILCLSICCEIFLVNHNIIATVKTCIVYCSYRLFKSDIMLFFIAVHPTSSTPTDSTGAKAMTSIITSHKATKSTKLASPFTSVRLRPIRQRTRNAIVSVYHSIL